MAVFAGLLGCLAAAAQSRFGWTAGGLLFAAANAVLLLDYSRLYLPHVRRRFERRLEELSRQRDDLLLEVRAAQQAARSAGMVHVKACIFLHSVNVIRNINYLALCVKAEVHRAGAGPRAQSQRRRVASCGLQLMLALLPHCDPEWQMEALQGEDCGAAMELLYGPRRGGSTSRALLAGGLAEARKRLWILFRMVHLSSALPSEVHGQLGALAELYLRPVLVEHRVPLTEASAFAPPDGQGPEALLDASAANVVGGDRSTRPVLALEDDEVPQRQSSAAVSDTWTRRSSVGTVLASESAAAGDEDEEDGDSFYAPSSNSSASMGPRRGLDRHVADTSKALRKLTATRGDIVRVLSRLHSAGLLDPFCENPQSEQVLNDIFSSVIIMLPSNAGDTTPSGARGGRVVGAAIGFRRAARSYVLDGLQTSIVVELAVPATEASGEGHRGELVEHISAQLTAVLDEEPTPMEISAAWGIFMAASPANFGEVALKMRRRALRRAKEAVRSFGVRGGRPQ